MKTYDLASILEKNASLLRSHPNVEIEDIFSLLIQLATNSKGKLEKTKQKEIEFPNDLISKLEKMSANEVRDYLLTNELFPTSSSLQKLAAMLKISSSKRQSKEGLANMISKYFEANNMDSMIRSVKSTQD